jgi:signal transduction histidine kinase
MEMINDIHDSSIRLIQIVNDFLNVSRLEQGKMEYKIDNFDLSELIDKKIAEVNVLSTEKNIQVKFDKPATAIPNAYADKDRVGEVLLNLLGNGIKYSDKDDIVNIQVSVIPGFLKVLVIDTGKGIPIEQQGLLFRKFQQAGKSILTRDTTQATGLGLYISRLMIEQMKGEIGLDKSVAGVGSTFFFTIPVTKSV